MKDKKALREQFLKLLKDQGSTERQLKSQKIAELLFKLPVFIKAQTVLFYASTPSEVDTFAMMQQAKQLEKIIALPSIQKNQMTMRPLLTESLSNLKKSPYGFQEPDEATSKAIDVASLDVVIVPGLAFDRKNNRLGRGAGYYDRFLSTLSEHTVTIGIAFDFQVVDSLPVEQHDVALDVILSA